MEELEEVKEDIENIKSLFIMNTVEKFVEEIVGKV